jgi:hypothetical protein
VYNRNRVSMRQEASYCAVGIELLYNRIKLMCVTNRVSMRQEASYCAVGIELLYNRNQVSVRHEPG